MGIKILRKIMYVSTPNPKLYLTKSSMHEEKWFIWVSNMEFEEPPKSFILDLLKDPGRDYLLFACFKLVQIFVKPYLGFDQDSNGHKNSNKTKNQST